MSARLIPTADANTTASWVSETSGDWTNPGSWSTSPNFPNNGTPGPIYDVVINAPGNNLFTITLSSDITVNSLTLSNDGYGSLDQTAGTLQAGTVNINADGYFLEGGTLTTTTLNMGAPGGFVDQTGGTIDAETVNVGTANINSGVYQLNSGTLANATVNLNGGSFAVQNATLSSVDITAGDLPAASLQMSGDLRIEGSLTVGSHVTVQGGFDFFDNSFGDSDDTLINNGTMNAAGPLSSIAPSNFTNNGTVQASNGGTLEIAAANWINNGTISVTNNSSVILGGVVAGANLGTITADATSTVSLGGTINGGTLNVTGGGAIVVNDGATLNGVTITGGDLQVTEFSDLTIQNGITITNHNLDLGGGDNLLVFDGPSQSLDNLNIAAAGPVLAFVGGPTSVGNQVLTLGTHVTVQGGVHFDNRLDNGSTDPGGTLINNGTINANDSSNHTEINVSNFTNNGTAEATNGGQLEINSDSYVNNGTISATNNGVVELDAGAISGDDVGNLTTDATGVIYLQNTFIGGTINVGGGNIFVGQAGSGGCLLNGVTITGGDLHVSSILGVENGITIANHNLDLSAGSKVYFVGGNQSVDNLNITPSGSANMYTSGPILGGPWTLTLGANVVVHGGVTFSTFTAGDFLINNGIINADTSAYVTNINLDNFTNNGTAEASNGGTLKINSPNAINNGTISAINSSSVYLTGTTSGINAGKVTSEATSSIYLGGVITIGSNGGFSGAGTLNSSANITNSGSFMQSGPQTWAANTTFTNSAGTATFGTDTGSASAAPLAIVDNGGSVTFGSTQHLASLSISSGASATVSASTPRNVIVTGSLSVAGSLNLTNNDMIVHSGNLGTVTAVGSITNEIAQGRGAGGLWTGSGITSSLAAATPGQTAIGVELNNNGSGGTFFTTFDGQTVMSTDVLVKYTYAGDADLSGTVNAADYLLIDNGFNSGGTKTGWRNGDFNYDGAINGDDYTLIDNAFNTQGSVSFASASAGPAEMIAADTDQIAAVSVAAVPEPGTLGLLAVGVVGLLMPRRLNRRRVSVVRKAMTFSSLISWRRCV